MRLNKANVYCWSQIPNWGDQMGFEIIAASLRSSDHIIPVQKVDNINDANIVGIGSTLGHIPEDWTGIVAGSGLHKENMCTLPHAKLLGVRGTLTSLLLLTRKTRDKDFFRGDPGLIAPFIYDLDFARKHTERSDIGIIPHWSDTALKYDSRFHGPWKTKYINPFRPVKDVITDIISCDKIVTSSLHGTVIADAYGIPRRIVPSWVMLNSPYEGGMFKFEDYMSALDMRYQPEVLEKADANAVEKVQADILKVYTRLPTYFK